MTEKLIVGLSQIAPVWLDKTKTIKKIISEIEKAAKKRCKLVIFGEAILPGYPFWVGLTNGAEFNSKIQKEIFTHYFKESIDISGGELIAISKKAKELSISVYLGAIEKAADRGGHSLYCSMVYINSVGEIKSVHRKLMPTYEERLVWSIGDGNGLKVHQLDGFTLGGLNCWENWMPMARTALYSQGENVHVAIWPGSVRNTEDITRMIAKESRSYVISVSGLMRKIDIPKNLPYYKLIMKNFPDMPADGGSCIANPDGTWLLEPLVGKEKLLTAELNIDSIIKERHNFDASGHYSRPDVLQLFVNRDRQTTAEFND